MGMLNLCQQSPLFFELVEPTLTSVTKVNYFTFPSIFELRFADQLMFPNGCCFEQWFSHLFALCHIFGTKSY